MRPWREIKSRRGAPKRVNTQDFACPNHQCPYFGIIDAHIHASFWGWQAWPCRANPDFSLSSLPYYFHCPAQHSLVPSENPLSSDRNGADLALAEGLDPSAAERVFGFRQATITSLSIPCSPCTRKPCTSASSAISTSRISSWTNYAPGYAAPNRCCGSGWPATLARRFFPCSIWVPAHKTWRTCSSTPCDGSWPMTVCRSSPVMA